MLPREASMVKLFVTEAAKRVALEGMQMMGGYGYSSEYDMERLVRARRSSRRSTAAPRRSSATSSPRRSASRYGRQRSLQFVGAILRPPRASRPGFSSVTAVRNRGDMARGDVRIAVTLACEECKRRNYQTQQVAPELAGPHRAAQVLPLVRPPHAAQGNALRRWRRRGHSARPSAARARPSRSARASAGRVARPARHPGAEVRRGRRGRGRRGGDRRRRSRGASSRHPTRRSRPGPSAAPSETRAQGGREAHAREDQQAPASASSWRRRQKQAAGGAPARRGHRLPRLLLGRAEEGPVARPRHPGPGHRGDHHLRRRRGRLPRRARRASSTAHQADPLDRERLLDRCIAGT